MKFLTRLIQLTIISTPLVLLGFLVNQQIAPGGTFFVEHRVDKESPFLDKLAPDQRVRPVGGTGDKAFQSIIGDPAFFFVHPQRVFDTATFEVLFENKTVPIVEFGGLARTSPESYNLHPFQNLIIDKSSWPRLEQDGLVLLQREPTYDSIDAFLSSPPTSDRLALYNMPALSPYRLTEYRPSSQSRTITVSLRGRHEFKTYIKDETLDMMFEYMDMNRDEGADPIVVTVFDEQGRPIADARAEDDGDVTKLARPSRMRSVRVNVPDLSEGVYKVIFDVSRDVFIRHIQTPQSKLVVMNMIYLGDEVAYREPSSSVVFYTNAKRLRAQTRHGDSVQTIKIGDGTMTIEEPYVMYTYLSPARGLVDARVEHVDVEFFVDGPTAFTPDMFFSPDPERLAYYTDLDAQGIDFILARYRSPESQGDWLVQRVDVDLRGLHFETDDPDQRFFRDGNWKFVFSAPGIDEIDGQIDIHAINVLFEGKRITLMDFIRFFKKR